jgi:hypothetical protein
MTVFCRGTAAEFGFQQSLSARRSFPQNPVANPAGFFSFWLCRAYKKCLAICNPFYYK